MSKSRWWNIIAAPTGDEIASDALRVIRGKVTENKTLVRGDVAASPLLTQINDAQPGVFRDGNAAMISHCKDSVLRFGDWDMTPEAQGLSRLGCQMRRKGVRHLYLLGCLSACKDDDTLIKIQEGLNAPCTEGRNPENLTVFGTTEVIGAPVFEPYGLEEDYLRSDKVVSSSARVPHDDSFKWVQVSKWLARGISLERSRLTLDSLLVTNVNSAEGALSLCAVAPVAYFDEYSSPAGALGLGGLCESSVAVAPSMLMCPDLCVVFRPGREASSCVVGMLYFGGRLICVPTQRSGEYAYYTVRAEMMAAVMDQYYLQL